MIGTRLGNFKILSLLGEGGMGAVYRAEDTRLGREVAIKILPEAFAGDAERLARFQREAQVVAGLNHPNICALFDVGEADGVHHLVMELVEGQSLAKRIEAGVSLEEAIGVATQIAEALEAAHAQGIVHRDLKPANVMLTAEGMVKVLDFGLAKGQDATNSGAGLSNSPTLTHHMTQAGMILGTAGYMSPEQARGGATDPRADIWAWGVILYEMLTGEQPFEGPTVSDTLAAVLRADLDWDKLPKETPRRVRRVLRRCLERDAGMRLHSVADGRIELLSSDGEPEADANSDDTATRPGKGAWVAAAVVAALGLAAGAAGWWTRPAAVEQPPRILEVTSGERLIGAVLSPDGRYVALNRAGQLFLRALDSTVETQVEGADDLSSMFSLFWSPDSRRIGYVTADEIYTIPLSGGAPQRACAIPASTYGEGTVLGATWWMPDTLVFALDVRGLWQVPVVGGEPEVFLLPDREEKNEAALHLPLTLLDGKTLVSRVRWSRKANDTFTFLRDGKRTDLTYPEWNLDEALVTPSGYLVFIRGGRDGGIWAAPFSMDTLQPTGDPVRVLAGQFRYLSLADDETLVTVAATDARSRPVTVDREGRILRTWEGLGYERDLAVSPDGQRLAVWGIQVHDGQRVVQASRGRDSAPAWSPDGRELIYDARGGGLFRALADGTREPVQVLEDDGSTPHWSPAGKDVAFSLLTNDAEGLSERDILLGRDTRADIAVFTLGQTGPPRLFRDTTDNEMYPRFSPDGRYMAYASDATDRFEIYVTTYPEGDRRWQVSEGGGRFPRWSHRGDEIFYVSRGHLMATPFRAGPDVVVGTPKRLMTNREPNLKFSGFGQTFYDVTPDGNFAVMSFKSQAPQRVLLIQNWLALLEQE